MYKVRQIILRNHCRFMSSSIHRLAPLLLSPSQAISIPQESRLFVDATWFMPNVPRNPKQEFEKIRLPDAQFLDLDEVAAHTEDGAALGLKHMMPSPVTFAKACGKFASIGLSVCRLFSNARTRGFGYQA